MPEHVNFNTLVQEVKTIRQGRTDTITRIVSAGQSVKLEISPDGEEVAAGVVPEGKVWEMDFVFAIVERDA